MSKYIDADKILSHLNDEIEGCEDPDVYFGLQYARSIVETAEAADVIQVVRCKDCAIPHNRWTGCPKLNGLVTPPSFYCSYGERRKEDAVY